MTHAAIVTLDVTAARPRRSPRPGNGMSSLGTHVLGAAFGIPAAGVAVRLDGPPGVGSELEHAVTVTDHRTAFEGGLAGDRTRSALRLGRDSPALIAAPPTPRPPSRSPSTPRSATTTWHC